MTDAQAAQTKLNRGHPRKPTLWDEAGNVLFLVILYCLQGVPLGLSMGSMPFLLQENASYTSIGIFGIAAYPYSCKLFWSPVVDSVYSRRVGRRRSWIIPLQTLSAVMLYCCADSAESALKQSDVLKLSAMFFVLVLLAATQDVAVDGWALTLLSRGNLGYTSTCQTIGMNAGFFLSFTVFLAFNDPDFCNRYFRSAPLDSGIVTLSGYMKCWGIIYAAVTLYITLWKTEKDIHHGVSKSLRGSYAQLLRVLKLPAVLRLSSVLLLCRMGSVVSEAAGTLKLLEKGMSKEALSGIVLIQFPIELFTAVLAGKWVSGDDALSPFIYSYNIRLVISLLSTFLIYGFPPGAAFWIDAPLAFLAVVTLGLSLSFVATFMFTAQGAFFSQISDPEMGGVYLTLLNTISNMGSSLPRFFIFWLLDQLTVRECRMDREWRHQFHCPSRKDGALASNPCTDQGGVCEITKDGFFPLSYTCFTFGMILGQLYFTKTLSDLKRLPAEAWRDQQQTTKIRVKKTE